MTYGLTLMSKVQRARFQLEHGGRRSNVVVLFALPVSYPRGRKQDEALFAMPRLGGIAFGTRQLLLVSVVRRT